MEQPDYDELKSDFDHELDDKRKADTDAARRMAQSYFETFKTPAGQTVLKHLESICQAKTTIQPEEEQGRPIDPLALAIREGTRQTYWQIAGWIDLYKETIDQEAR